MLDPLGALSADQLKEIKQWGTIEDFGTSSNGHWQKPTNDALLHSDPEGGRTFSLGATSANYTFKGGLSDVYDVLSGFPSSPNVPGAKGVEVTMTQDGEPLATISVTVHEIQMNPRGETPKEAADFGSDGEGNPDYGEWSMKNDEKVTDDKWSIVWEDTTAWPPFAYMGKQLIDPWCLSAYKLITDGGRFVGDVVTMNVANVPCRWPINQFRQHTNHSADYGKYGWNMGDLEPIEVGSVAYKKLMQGRMLVLTHTWSKQWVTSVKKYEKMKDGDPLTPEEEEDFNRRHKMGKGGLVVSTSARGNEDGPVKSGVKTSKTVTVTRTYTYKIPYDEDSKKLIPYGLKVSTPDSKDPEPTKSEEE